MTLPYSELEKSRGYGVEGGKALAKPGAAVATFGEAGVRALTFAEGGEGDAGFINGLVDGAVEGEDCDRWTLTGRFVAFRWGWRLRRTW